MNINLQKFEIKPGKLNYRDLMIFILPIIIFSLYAYIYNPGILTIASFGQLHQIATGDFNMWDPFFHTFIEMICLKIYSNPIIIAILQILTFSTIWTIICKYHRDDTIKNSNQFVLQFFVTFIICLIPINAIYSITLWKEILFSYSLLFLSFLIKVLIDKKGHIDLKFTIIFAITMAITSQLNINGIYIILILLIIIITYIFKKDRHNKMLAVLPALTVIFILLIASLNVVYDVSNEQKDQTFIYTAHILADYDLNLDISKEDKTKIQEMMNETQIKNKFMIYYPDSIKNIANKEIFDKNRDTYINMAIGYSLSNPLEFIKYTFQSSAIVWEIMRNADWQGEPYYIYEDGAHLKNARDQYFASIKEKPQENFETMTSANIGNEKYNLINSYVYTFKENKVLDTIFNSPALYMYLAIILLIFLQVLTKSKEIYLVYLPNLLNIFGILALTPVQENRYLYGNLLVFYLLIIILISIWYGLKQQAKPITSNTQKTKKHNRQLTYNSNENVYDTQYDSIDNIESPPKHQTVDEINSQLNKQSPQSPQKSTNKEEINSDLVDQILKEIEMERKNNN